MRQFLLSVLFFSTFLLESKAQESCEVKLKDIQGSYTGECLKGKASGKGKAVGIDQYEGEFKNGYPDGWGMYTWKDGHYFIGRFKKGLMEGRGDMYYESSKGEDSIITGFWKKDVYIGPYEKAWEVINRTTKVNKVDCSKISSSGSVVKFTLQQLSAGYIPFISSQTVMKGNFETQASQTLTNQSVTRYQHITFPFQVVLYFSGSESVELLFNEPGDYDVYISLSQ